MRLSLPTARQNEVQRCWRRAGRLLGKPGDGRPKMRFTGQVWRTTGPSGVRAAWEQRAGRRGAKRGSSRGNGRAGMLARARTRFKSAREGWARGGQTRFKLGAGAARRAGKRGGRRKGRGKSRDPSRAREDLGDLEKRLAKVELHLVDGEERFEEVDTRLMELDERMEELRGDMQGALNAAFDKLASEGESLRLSQMGEIAALRDENRSLKEQLEWAMGKLKEVEQQVSLVAMAVARGGVATTSGASLVIPSRVEVPKPSVYSGARNAKEIDNFLWSLEQYFRAIGITEDAKKVDHAPLYLVDTAMVWWRRRHGDMEKGLCTIASWDEFKRELKRQFYPENAAHEARARLRHAEALFAFTDGLQTWARMEIERRGARDLATAISIAESLVEFQRSERSRTSPQKDRSEGGDSRGKDGSSKPKEVQPRSQREDRGMQRPPLSCFLCDGPHRARECPKKSKLSALVEEREKAPFQPREATMGSLQLSALKVQEKGTVNVEKGRPFVQIQVGGQELRALLDTGASHNFLTVEEAKRLGIPYEKEMGWLKAVNSTPNLIHGVARDTKVRIGDWRGTLDFFVVSMDDSPCILGVEFVDRAKAIPMLFANSMCITEGGGTCVVPLLRGKASNTLATMHVEMQDPSSAAQGEKQHGKGGGTPKKDPKCKRGHSEVAEGATTKGEGGLCKGRCSSQKSKEGALPEGNVCGSRFSGQTGQPGKQESCREEQAKMRLSLPTARQNEVQRCWRRAGRLLGKPGDGRPKMRFTGQVWRTTGPSGVRAAWEQRAADEARNEVHRAGTGARECWARARTRFKSAREGWARARQTRFKLGAGAARRAGKRGSPEGSRSAWRALGARGRNAGRARAASPPNEVHPRWQPAKTRFPASFLPTRPNSNFGRQREFQLGMKAINRDFGLHLGNQESPHALKPFQSFQVYFCVFSPLYCSLVSLRLVNQFSFE
ncbi:hypothetical protein GH714_014403 [Hevea brasiliensis]|uniref:Retrotransposon gag domain-containing protein n=1 Tax=Hevea brasiliensis TaxID=3981 RepID=A0A6A6LST2_HEVBR|nr:hypothetical protein GH714_014403 [Hevea brasiliensis]